TTLTFTWNTTGYAKGNYTISAYAEPVLGETNMEDNTSVGDLIIVTIPGDFSGDHKVGPYDFALLSIAYGSSLDKPSRWNPNCDVNNDGKVGPFDFAVLCVYYGKHDP
ncbi:MAG: dockerin type I domain-containing protein, partial [Fervidobacterium sp.]